MEEAIKRYTHMRPENYADFVDIASRTDAGITLPVGLPAIDPGNFVAEISGTIAEIGAPPPRKGAAPRRRTAAASSSSTADAPTSPRQASVSHDLSEAGFALDAGSDPWDLVGTSCSVPNEIWGRLHRWIHPLHGRGLLLLFQVRGRQQEARLRRLR